MFSEKLEQLLPDLRAYARMLCRDTVRADDIVQNACLKAWQNRDQFDPDKGPLRGWLFRIVRNEFFRQKRADRVREADAAVRVNQQVIADCDLEPRTNLDRMLQAVDSLKHAQRDAFLLVAAAGFTYDEAADVLGCSAGTVKSRVSRARDIALGRFFSEEWTSQKHTPQGSPIKRLHESLNAIQTVSTAA